ncbi:MAG: hypothetical protein AAF639_25245 [Chloroflexota bacterium]
MTSLQHKPTLVSGETLLANLTAEGQVDGSLKISARLVDAHGAMVAQQDKVLSSTMRFTFDIPKGTAPGRYQLLTIIYDPETLQPIPDEENSVATILSEIEIRTTKTQITDEG